MGDRQELDIVAGGQADDAAPSRGRRRSRWLLAAGAVAVLAVAVNSGQLRLSSADPPPPPEPAVRPTPTPPPRAPFERTSLPAAPRHSILELGPSDPKGRFDLTVEPMLVEATCLGPGSLRIDLNEKYWFSQVCRPARVRIGERDVTAARLRRFGVGGPDDIRVRVVAQVRPGTQWRLSVRPRFVTGGDPAELPPTPPPASPAPQPTTPGQRYG